MGGIFPCACFFFVWWFFSIYVLGFVFVCVRLFICMFVPFCCIMSLCVVFVCLLVCIFVLIGLCIVRFCLFLLIVYLSICLFVTLVYAFVMLCRVCLCYQYDRVCFYVFVCLPVVCLLVCLFAIRGTGIGLFLSVVVSMCPKGAAGQLFLNVLVCVLLLCAQCRGGSRKHAHARMSMCLLGGGVGWSECMGVAILCACLLVGFVCMTSSTCGTQLGQT